MVPSVLQGLPASQPYLSGLDGQAPVVPPWPLDSARGPPWQVFGGNGLHRPSSFLGTSSRLGLLSANLDTCDSTVTESGLKPHCRQPSTARFTASHLSLPGGGTMVSVRPCQVAVLCMERAQAASLNRMEKHDGSNSSCSLLPCRSASSG